MKTVLITGGAGFIGSHLCDLFLAKGFKVICMDNLITGSEKNITHLKDEKNFTFINHDITDFIGIKEDVDAVLHFASPASPAAYQEMPIQTLKANSIGTHNALGMAKRKNAKFLLASTSEVYGDPQVHPQPETYWGNVNSVGIRGCYDEGKRFSEAITMAYHRAHKLDTMIARIFNTYGPRMGLDDGRVVPSFMMQAIRKKPLTIFGDGSQTRSFCYITDLVEGVYRLLNSKINEPVNLGNPYEMTIKEFAEKVLEITSSSSAIAYQELPKDDPRVRRPDISKAKKLLGWKPKVKVGEGLKKTFRWFKEHYTS